MRQAYAALARGRLWILPRVVGWIRDSAGIPNFLCSRLIMSIVRGRLRFMTSEPKGSAELPEQRPPGVRQLPQDL